MRKANSWFLAAVLMCTLGMWGCNSQKSGTFNAKIREMETRHGKLEEDFRMVTASAEQTQKKVTQAEAKRVEAEEKVAELNKRIEELQSTVQERDELRKTLQTRTTERDTYQGQLMQFSRDLQALAGKVEVAAGPMAPTNTAATTTVTPAPATVPATTTVTETPAPMPGVTIAIPASRTSE